MEKAAARNMSNSRTLQMTPHTRVQFFLQTGWQTTHQK